MADSLLPKLTPSCLCVFRAPPKVLAGEYDKARIRGEMEALNKANPVVVYAQVTRNEKERRTFELNLVVFHPPTQFLLSQSPGRPPPPLIHPSNPSR